jgi:hypothetical protein
MWPEVMKAIELDSLGKSAKPIDYPRLLDNVPFKNALASNVTFRQYMLDTYRGLKRRVSNLIGHIESELKILEE